MRLKLLLAMAISAVCVSAQAAPAFDPRAVKAGIPGGPTEVLVLGTMHLSELPDSFQPAWLDPLLTRLQAWKPEVITVEGLSGPECEMLKAYGSLYADAADSYCIRVLSIAGLGQAATGLTMARAAIKAEGLLAAWPAAPTPAQRRELAASFAAAGDINSALVQWLRLPPDERKAGEGLSGELAAALTTLQGRRNENTLVAVPLAARLGLERVYPTDDHTADAVAGGPDAEACGQEIQAVWAKIDDPAFAAMQARHKAIASGEDLLSAIRILNAPEMQLKAITLDQIGAMRTPSGRQCGRKYMAWWETRNLRMVANIRAAFGPRPGARVLSIVGASHKPYFEAYLDMVHEVRLADADAVLR
ncbi:DUF5694 domain-containing protein [Caulobacter sp. NIBR1757]|uniref:DUF5694 domain-containing protein n=1 Tax=Caulobacter sp. NIBR1757 TaxID=3016000 RepID=UPI0022F13E14|nr:DUF5694 domain-containing protein [Caulobacter sp. NIBR1757]WGM41172.1 hypothetical protein AMEJIAPC_04121 [Caulobacter sp. NIBR1757]